MYVLASKSSALFLLALFGRVPDLPNNSLEQFSTSSPLDCLRKIQVCSDSDEQGPSEEFATSVGCRLQSAGLEAVKTSAAVRNNAPILHLI